MTTTDAAPETPRHIPWDAAPRLFVTAFGVLFVLPITLIAIVFGLAESLAGKGIDETASEIADEMRAYTVQGFEVAFWAALLLAVVVLIGWRWPDVFLRKPETQHDGASISRVLSLMIALLFAICGVLSIALCIAAMFRMEIAAQLEAPTQSYLALIGSVQQAIAPAAESLLAVLNRLFGWDLKVVQPGWAHSLVFCLGWFASTALFVRVVPAPADTTRVRDRVLRAWVVLPCVVFLMLAATQIAPVVLASVLVANPIANLIFRGRMSDAGTPRAALIHLWLLGYAALALVALGINSALR